MLISTSQGSCWVRGLYLNLGLWHLCPMTSHFYPTPFYRNLSRSCSIWYQSVSRISILFWTNALSFCQEQEWPQGSSIYGFKTGFTRGAAKDSGHMDVALEGTEFTSSSQSEQPNFCVWKRDHPTLTTPLSVCSRLLWLLKAGSDQTWHKSCCQALVGLHLLGATSICWVQIA